MEMELERESGNERSERVPMIRWSDGMRKAKEGVLGSELVNVDAKEKRPVVASIHV